jgi:ketosteroid isomerase-like protein
MDRTEIQLIQWECQQLLNRVTNLMDACQWDALAACYAEDAVMYRPSDPTRGIEGRDAILASFRARPPRTTCHVLANSVFDVHSAVRVTATSRVLLFSGDVTAAMPGTAHSKLLIGSFTDDLIREGDRWLIGTRVGNIELAYDYE